MMTSVQKLIAQTESERQDVVVDVFSATLNELMDQYKNQDLEISPDYQRAFRWSISQQTRYIESLLLNIPTPPIFLAENKDGVFEIIDGLQRFSTILKFFANEISGNDINPEDKSVSQNDISIPTLLTDAPILTGLNGVSRETMPDTLIRTLRYARVQVMLLKKESSPLARFHVFTRLNRAGSTLSNQEIRNCSARLFDPTFADELLEISNDPNVTRAMNLSEKELRSMGGAENILRLIAFSHFKPNQRVEEFLDDVMYSVSSKKFKFTKSHQTKIIQVFSLVNEAFPEGGAFRFWKGGTFRGGFSTNLYDIIACGIYKNISAVARKKPDWLHEKIIKLHNNKEALDLTGAGSNARSKIMGRIEFGHSWFSA